MTDDVKPIFLLSLPRCGSTLVQRILATNQHIASAAEPWLLLPFMYALRTDGVYSEYHHQVTVPAIKDFLKELPNGDDDYYEALREFATNLYRRAATHKPDARYFLDKTPPYCLIAPEIVKAFPDAKFIFLWRNPLAMVASFIESFHNGKWTLNDSKPFLFKGFERILEAYEQVKDRAIAIQYEQLLLDPETSVRRMTDFLEIDYRPDMHTKFNEVAFKGTMGDPTGRRKYTEIDTQPLEKWKQTLSSPVRKSWCRRYLNWMGENRLSTMGYDRDGLIDELNAIPPWRSIVIQDIYRTMKDVFVSLVEPAILKDKFRSPRDWRRVWNHF